MEHKNTMTKKDVTLSFIIGGAVGILAQPIISNFAASIGKLAAMPVSELRVISFLIFLFGAPIALAVFYFFSRFVPVLYQFAKFASVGVLNTTVDLGVFNLETFLYGSLPAALIFSVFKAISFLTATTNSYIWNKYWTFGANAAPHPGEVAKFYIIAILGGFLNVGVATAVRVSNPSFIPANMLVNIVAPMCGILAVFMWNFLGYKFIVFKKYDSGEHAS